jgi:precorrin-8X/cobalt-precorrin-8 methylmutase
MNQESSPVKRLDSPAEPVGILIVGHGSPRTEANRGFQAMVTRVAARLGEAAILPTFFSITEPDIPERVATLVEGGAQRILLLPYFLYSGQHVTVDIPALLDQCRQRFPGVTLEMLPTLENDPALEDLVVERLTPLVDRQAALPSDAGGIERRSYEIIDRQLGDWGPADPGMRQIVRRVVHATADISFARTLRIHPRAVERGRQALAERRPIVCDVKMLQAGMTKIRGEILCAIDGAEAAALAQARGGTRAAAAMELLAPRLEGAIVAVGNAPSALWKVMELARQGGPRPALVVGLPVGLVGAREAKQVLLESDLCYITNVGPRGGSPVAAAAVNALAMLERKES